MSVRQLVGHTLLFFMIFILGPYCSCPKGLVVSNTAPAHPRATCVAVYPALFSLTSDRERINLSLYNLNFFIILMGDGSFAILVKHDTRILQLCWWQFRQYQLISYLEHHCRQLTKRCLCLVGPISCCYESWKTAVAFKQSAFKQHLNSQHLNSI